MTASPLPNGHRPARSHIDEIDSLRALAVVAVVLFHAYPWLLPGGVIGVDVFFVISGFVIARSYLGPMIRGERTLKQFYLARFRRLAPALAVVLLLTAAVAVFLLPPDRLKLFGWSLFAQPFYLQNFFFWSEGNYFDRSLTHPLLHTWSLAVEEQFYLLWAVLILWCRRHPRHLVWTLLVLAALSFAVGWMLETRSPQTVFYHLPTRIWEFAIGILTCLALPDLAARSAPWRRWASLPAAAGVLGIAAAAAAWREEAAFPGPQAVLACLSTALVLVAVAPRSGDAALRWLRARPALYVGRISYGFYLWHWPPLSLWFLATGSAAPPAVATALMVLAFLGAAASFRLVEEPIRRGRLLPSPRALIAFVAASSAALAALAILVLATNGLMQRYPVELRAFLAAPGERGVQRCGKLFTALHPRAEMCPLYDGAARHDDAVLILGDSHADVIKEAIAETARAIGRDVYLTTRNCDLGEFGAHAFCSPDVLRRIIAQARSLGVTRVVAVSFWPNERAYATPLGANLRVLTDAGFPVVIVRRTPGDPGYDPRLRAEAAMTGAALGLSGISLARHRADVADVDWAIDIAVATAPAERVSVVDPATWLCPGAQCLYEIDGTPLYLDGYHLSFAGGVYLKPMLDSLLRR